ncbi:hypothetical protein ACL02R_21065 [Streptomyces sp. MS19]|uniref:hypothetical protein n=1 Tax=Streptomyces sp. MS19 TaxID=3385972 RepID=UPI0039A003E3
MSHRPYTDRLFPGGGRADDVGAAREWVRETLAVWGRAEAVPVVDALIDAARTRRPWWLSLRDHNGTLHAQVLRGRAASTPELNGPPSGTYGIAHTPDGLCLWATTPPTT